MKNNKPIIANRQPVHWTAVNNYRMRAGSFFCSFFVIATHLWDQGYSPAIWGLLAFQFLVYPHLMYLRAARAADSRKAELNNMLIDSVLFGLWMASLKFPLLITLLLFFTALMNNTVLKGVKGLLQGFISLSVGVLISVALLGWHFVPQTAWITTLLCMFVACAYLITIALLAYGATQRLLKTRQKLI